MKYTKILNCGNKKIEISADTKAEIRLATNDEREMFQKKHWDVPDELPCQTDMWESMCEMLNGLKSTLGILEIDGNEIRCRFLESLGIESDGPDGSMSHCRFKFVPADEENKENVIQIELTFTRNEAVTDSFGNTVYYDGCPQYKKIDTDRTALCQYPQDFFALIDAIEWSSIKTSGRKISEFKSMDVSMATVFEYQGKTQQKNWNKISHFIALNLREIKHFRAYAFAWNKILARKDFKAFCESRQRVLDVDGEIFFEFENECGFDIEKKQIEIQIVISGIKSKISNSNDPGEKEVEYAISWFRDTYKEHYMLLIKHDCESSYRYDCILLRKRDFRDEPQEYDHILVCAAGVVLIETKHWKGIVEVRPDGQLVRKTDDENCIHGEAGTLSQMDRHEELMKRILPGVSVYSILCLTNRLVVIDGKENMNRHSIVTIDQLQEALLDLCSKGTYSKEEMDRMADEIEKHKVRNANLK